MPDKRFTPDTVTVFNYLGDGEYRPTVLRSVKVCSDEAVFTRDFTSGSSTRVYVFLESVISDRRYVSPELWDAAPDKEPFYTFRGGVDLIAAGECTKATAPPAEALTVNEIKKYSLGNRSYILLVCR